jgi:signal transduction histidine kinase
MSRLHAGRALRFESRVREDLDVRVPLEDLEEMLGNLIDNACKWTRSQVLVSATQQDMAVVEICVDDDGDGVEESLRERVLQRGERADEVMPGSGLGLAITRDLAEAYGGVVALERSPQGGLRVQLRLPGASGRP